jgi:hypothetical protein
MKELVFQLVCPLTMCREKQECCIAQRCAGWNVGGYCNICQAGNVIASVLTAILEEL